MFKTELVIKKIPNTKYWLLEHPLIWHGPMRVEVPPQFKTDLTTRWFEGRHTEASVIHDYLLIKGHRRRDANEMMRLAMIDLRVPTWRRRLIFLGVTVWGWLKWR